MQSSILGVLEPDLTRILTVQLNGDSANLRHTETIGPECDCSGITGIVKRLNESRQGGDCVNVFAIRPVLCYHERTA